MEPPSDSPLLPPHGITASLDAATRQRLAAKGIFQDVKKGHTLVAQGEVHNRLFVLLEGEAVVTCYSPGQVIEIARLKAGDSIGEMSVMDPRPGSADVTLTSDGSIWSITRDDFFAFIHEDKDAGIALLLALAAELTGHLRHDDAKMLRQFEYQKDYYRANDY